MRIAAVSVQMDSWSILASNVAHLIGQGITDFYIMDHASKRDGRGYFEEVFGQDASFKWFRKATRPFFQAAMTTFLVDQAKDDGFDVALIFDADEFFLTRAPESTLRETIAREIQGQDYLVVEAKNYVAPVTAELFSLDSLRFSQFDSRALDPILLTMALGNLRLQVHIKNLGKTVLNLKGWQESSRVSTGNHYALGRGKASAELFFIHFPFWSLGSIQQRQDHGTNLRLSGAESGIGGHNLSLSGVEPAVAWTQNTWPLVPFATVASNPSPSEEVTLLDVAVSIASRYPSRAFTDLEIFQSGQASSSPQDLSVQIDLHGPLIYSQGRKSPTSFIKRILRILTRVRFSLVTESN